MIQIKSRDTFHARAALKALGGRWDVRNQCWVFPNDKEEKVELLLRECGIVYSLRFVPDEEPP